MVDLELCVCVYQKQPDAGSDSQLMVGHYEHSLCGRTENVSTSAFDSLMEAIINLGFFKQ